MTTTSKTRRIPAPLFAAAGAGDVAYQRLRKLPEHVAQLRERVADLAPAVSGAVTDTTLRVDLDRIRGVARRNAANLVAGAQQAGERAAAVYSGLVSRGERVVAQSRATGASVEIRPAAGTVTATASATEPRRPVKKAVAKSTSAKSTPAKKA
jgi:hypothetical protein